MRGGRALAISRLEFVGALALTAGLTAIAVIFGALVLSTPPEPPLLQGLHGDRDAVRAQLTRRLAEQFPIGTPENKLIEALSDQGFEPQLWRPRPDGEMLAVLDRSSPPCKVVARVQWRADAAGRVTEIGGRYGEEGCW